MKLFGKFALVFAVTASSIAVGFGWRDIAAGETPNLRALPAALIGGQSSRADLVPARTFTDALANIDTFFYGETDREKLKYAGVQGMISALNDPHTVLLEPEVARQFDERNHGRFVGIGAELTKDQLGARVRAVFKNSPAERRGLKAADVITHVDDVAVSSMDIEEIVRNIRGEEGTRVKLTVFREDDRRSLDLTIERRQVQIQDVYAKVVDSDVGYIQVRTFSETVVAQFDEELADLERRGMSGLVIDLRGNPGGLLSAAVDLSSRFLDGQLVTTMKKRDGRNENFRSRGGLARKRGNYPLVILIDEGSASASEIFAGALRDHQVATLVGEHTYGKGSVQVVRPLSDGAQLKITIAAYYLPSKEPIQRKEDSDGNYLSGGIQPHVVVEQARGAVQGDPESDVQLQKALEVLRSKR